MFFLWGELYHYNLRVSNHLKSSIKGAESQQTNYIPSEVNWTLVGTTYPKWKKPHFETIQLSKGTKRSRLLTVTSNAIYSWWSPISRAWKIRPNCVRPVFQSLCFHLETGFIDSWRGLASFYANRNFSAVAILSVFRDGLRRCFGSFPVFWSLWLRSTERHRDLRNRRKIPAAWLSKSWNTGSTFN